MTQFYLIDLNDLRGITRNCRKIEALCKKAKDLNENLGSAIARGYYNGAYKDEYEVARLHTEYLKPN